MAHLTRRGALMSGGALVALAACGEAAKPPAPDANAAFDALSKTWLDELALSSPSTPRNWATTASTLCSPMSRALPAQRAWRR